ncbi:acyltransferase [soil metagenome]
MEAILPMPTGKAPVMRPYFARIDSLRGVGALAVAGYHFAGWQLHRWPLVPQSLQQFLPGHAALMVFFVISGFVLRVALQYGPARSGPATAKFLLARFFRIYPAVTVAICFIAFVPYCYVPTSRIPFNSSSAWDIFRNIALLDITANGTFWALQVEMLMVPVILATWFLERRYGPKVVTGLVIATTALAFEPHWALWQPLSHNVFAFMLGMAIPTAGYDWAWSRSRRTATLVTALSLIAMVASGPWFGTYSHVGGLVQGYAAFVLVSMVTYRPDLLVCRVMDWPWLQRVGQAAGSIYVFHMATLVPTILLAHAVIPASWSDAAPVVAGVTVLTVWLLAISQLARLGFKYIETPGIALGRRVIKTCGLDSKAHKPFEPEALPVRKAA